MKRVGQPRLLSAFLSLVRVERSAWARSRDSIAKERCCWRNVVGVLTVGSKLAGGEVREEEVTGVAVS